MSWFDKLDPLFRSITWNALNQLTAVTKNGATQASYGYDPMGRRVEKVAGTTTMGWAYDGEDILRQSATTSAVTSLTRFVHGAGIDEPLAMENVATSVLAYLHADALSSITQQTNALGAITDTISYDAWGNIQNGTPAPYGFTGREFDATIQMNQYRARYYDQSAGRFISEDPVDFGNGASQFPYVTNNPALLVDPSGYVATGGKNCQSGVSSCGGKCPSWVFTAWANACAEADKYTDSWMRECMKKKCKSGLQITCNSSECKAGYKGAFTPCSDSVIVCSSNPLPSADPSNPACWKRAIVHEVTIHACRPGGPAVPNHHPFDAPSSTVRNAVKCP